MKHVQRSDFPQGYLFFNHWFAHASIEPVGRYGGFATTQSTLRDSASSTLFIVRSFLSMSAPSRSSSLKFAMAFSIAAMSPGAGT